MKDLCCGHLSVKAKFFQDSDSPVSFVTHYFSCLMMVLFVFPVSALIERVEGGSFSGLD